MEFSFSLVFQLQRRLKKLVFATMTASGTHRGGFEFTASTLLKPSDELHRPFRMNGIDKKTWVKLLFLEKGRYGLDLLKPRLDLRVIEDHNHNVYFQSR